MIDVPKAAAEVHVAPIPRDHVPAASCYCGPIQSITTAGSTVYVHRTTETEPWERLPDAP